MAKNVVGPMMDMLSVPWLHTVLAIFAPWSLGYAVARACLKQRYGYQWLALGAGYQLGLLLIAVTMYNGHPPNDGILLAIVGVAGVIFFLWQPKPCYVDEQRLELPTPAWQRVLMWLLNIVLFLIFAMLAFVQHQTPPPTTLAMLLVHRYHVQTLAQYAYVWLWWLYPMLGCLTFGVLRYAQCDRFVAFLGMFTVLTLPIVIVELAAMWTGALWLIAMTSLTQVHRERRQILLCLLALVGLVGSGKGFGNLHDAFDFSHVALRDVFAFLFLQGDWGGLFYALVVCAVTWVWAKTNTGRTRQLTQTYWLFAILLFVLFANCDALVFLAPLFGILPALTFEACRFKPSLS